MHLARRRHEHADGRGLAAAGARAGPSHVAQSVLAEFEVALPAVLGIQAAKQAPRYAPISKVRAMMKEKKIETCAPTDGAVDAGVKILRMFKPVSGKHAEMLEGDADTVAERVMGILKERALVK